MDFGTQLFELLTNPNVAYLLLIVGLLLLLVAVTTPGTGVAEVTAIIVLVMATIGLINLSANFAGVMLVILGFVLFAVDATATNHGALTLGGAVTLLFGSLLLFPTREGEAGLSGWLIAGTTLGMSGFSALVVSALLRVRQQKGVDHVAQNMVGLQGVIKAAINPPEPGTAQVGGQLWTVSAEETIGPGASVEVVNRQGLTLHVKKTNP